jgi:hypothetical protein
MTLPHLPVVGTAIAGKKLVAAARLDDAEGCIRPGEAVINIRERWLSLLAGNETLRGRRDDDRHSHRWLADRSGNLGRAFSGAELEKADE